MTNPPVPTGLEEVTRQSVEDLCLRLGLPPADVAIVSAQSLTWPDRSLGCPLPGMMYPQVLVDGAKVVLAAGGRQYAYHAGGGRGPFLCEAGDAQA